MAWLDNMTTFHFPSRLDESIYTNETMNEHVFKVGDKVRVLGHHPDEWHEVVYHTPSQVTVRNQRGFTSEYHPTKLTHNPAQTNEETLDELSKKTLGSYIKKAAGGLKGVAAHAHKAGQQSAGEDPRFSTVQRPSDISMRKARKRLHGIDMATDKLTREKTLHEGKTSIYARIAAENKARRAKERAADKALEAKQHAERKVKETEEKRLTKEREDLHKAAHKAEHRGSQEEWEDHIAAVFGHKKKYPHIRSKFDEETLYEAGDNPHHDAARAHTKNKLKRAMRKHMAKKHGK